MGVTLRAANLGLAVVLAASCSGGAAGPTGAGGAAGNRGGAGGQAGAAGGQSGTAAAAGHVGQGGSAGGGASGASGTAGHGPGGAAGSGAAGSGTAGGGGTATAGSMAGAGGGHLGGAGGAGGGSAACQNISLQFSPRAPSVEILVDRAGPEFTTATAGTFFELRTAIENVVSRYAPAMRIGFTSYVGDRSTGSCSLSTASVPLASNNAAAIKTLYDALGPVLPFGTKTELPADAAIASVEPALEADPYDGDKYLLFATSGSTDFCDDPNQVCPADTVTSRLQTMFAKGIHTVVVGLPSSTIGTWAVQSFANAGAGQAVALPPSITDPANIYYQCMVTAPWMAEWTSRARTGTSPDATYATPGGSAPVYAPGSASWPDLTAAVDAAFASMRSCTFTLNNFQIVPAKVAEGSVKIDGTTVPLDAANGWNMPTSTAVQLNGAACTSWRTRTAQDIAFAFPCDAVQTN